MVQAVIDPSGPVVVGTAPENANLMGPWADFVTVPVPDELENKPLKATLVDDAWVLSLDMDTVTAQAWAALRTQRNALLAASDWTQFTDSPLSPEAKAAWRDYRSLLRNLPETVTDPTNVTWPTPP